jgi:hypothetical protein
MLQFALSEIQQYFLEKNPQNTAENNINVIWEIS